MASTKVRALDAAIELLGTEGLRALTHARVDERAGLPRGSSSNWFRTRDALFAGVCDHVVERETAAVAAQTPSTAAELVEALAGLVEFTTGPNRTLTTARLVLFMEASHNTTLREAVSTGRAAMEASLHTVLQRIGGDSAGDTNRSTASTASAASADPDRSSADSEAAAAALMGCAEGMILHRIARGDTTDPRPAFEVVVRGALGAWGTRGSPAAIG